MKKLVVRIASVITALCVCYMGVRSYKLHELTGNIKQEIVENRAELEREKEKLTSLQEELVKMDSLEYIEKIAMEEWGMVKEDTIIIKEKP